MKTSGWLVLFVVALSGCAQNQYDVELTPSGDALERKLRILRAAGAETDLVPDADARRIAAAYGAEPPRPAKKHDFQGRFSGRMPNDVGGYGTFTRWETPLGSVAVYVERFRGDDDLAGVLKRKQTIAYRLVDLLAGWLETEMRKDPQWPALRKFLHEDFRRDVYNLGIYAWTLRLAPQHDNSLPEPAVRAAQYLVERNYIAFDEIPDIAKEWHQDTDQNAELRLLRLKRLIAAKARHDLPPPRLDFMATFEQFHESLSNYLEKTDEYAILMTQWQDNLKTHRDTKRPEATLVMIELVFRLLGAWPYQADGTGGDRLNVTLKSGVPALHTNGNWDGETGQIKWPAQDALAEDDLPVVVYAAWNEPNEAVQTAHFGSKLLHGKRLLEYCLWYRRLTPGDREEWDACVLQLRPESDLAKELKGFRFHDEPADVAKDARRATPAVQAILGSP